MNEFDIIKRFFAQGTLSRPDVILGSGDDCALLQIPSNQQLAISIDTLIAGVHFPINTPAYDIGYKSLAVNLSDLAAMGAEPAWATMSLTLSEANEKWLDDFARGFFALAKQFNVQLVGGDLTHGPTLSITVQMHGFVPSGAALCRSGARVGDAIYVTGTLGDAGLALQLLQSNKNVSPELLQRSKQQSLHAKQLSKDIPAEQVSNAVSAKQLRNNVPAELLSRLNRPTPRIAVGLALRGIASSAIDISDGLVVDLGHILEESRMGATINVDHLPLSAHLKKESLYRLALTAGDDYELCFTVPPEHQPTLKNVLKTVGCSYQQIGVIESKRGLRVIDVNGDLLPETELVGYKHFY